MKKICTTFLAAQLAFFSQYALARGSRLYPEKVYQNAWCANNGGQTELVLQDKTRVDCILPEYAIEFDFADKWSEAIGQSLYYSAITKKKPAVVLILENEKRDQKYLNRLQTVSNKHGITVWTVSPNYIHSACK